jgi:uncharacterized membrane protein YGL010W
MQMALLSERTWEDWIDEYEGAHRHPFNRACHSIGIPLIAASVGLAPIAVFAPGLRKLDAALFVSGWALQILGHVVEGAPPEFLKDSRFLFVGLRWWLQKHT